MKKMMEIKAEISIPYPSKKHAENIQQSLAVDNEHFVTSKVQESVLLANIESKSLSSFLQTIDDYLSCVTVAENITKTKETEDEI